ncbi:glutathione transferase GST 23-like [Andrographis paniculata]|uniref:glutathione transferase GST 23-like n=1 Tax=Andrographis paniculata TaxID=175694 RepID=UPI0021E9ADA3|nr:glutathione transferase GST 23-like [Andrographis paniculata]
MEEEKKKSVKLVGYWPSPFAHRVKWALRLKGIHYEYIEEDIFDKTPLLDHINPLYGKVPVLIHGNKPLPESTIIIEYIDHIWSHNPLFPNDPLERAQLQVWAKFIDQKILWASWLAYCTEGVKQKNIIEKKAKEIIVAMEKLEKKIEGKRFFGEDTIGYLDLIVGFVAYLLPVIWEDLGSTKLILDPVKFPAIFAWTNNFMNHEVICAEPLPSRAEMLNLIRRRRESLRGIYTF